MVDIIARQETIRLREGFQYFNKVVVNNGKPIEVYNTGRGSATDFERLELVAVANQFQIRAVKLGGATVKRDIVLDPGTLLLVTSAMQLGTNPASSGQVRLPNNTSVQARNAANNGNIPLIGSNSGDEVEVAAGGQLTRVKGAVAVGTGTGQALSGDVRLANNRKVVARNAAGNGDVDVAHVNTSNQVVLGGPSVTVAQQMDLSTKELRVPVGASW